MHYSSRRLLLTFAAAALLGSGALDPAAVRAQACGEGDLALSDERGLAIARDSVEDDCPCEEYDGSPGSAREDYLLCAEEILGLVVDFGDLRAECVGAAQDDIAGSTCGTTDVACGKPSTSSSQAATCRVTSAASCGKSSGGSGRVVRRLARRGGAASGGMRAIFSRRSSGGGSRGAENACTAQTHCSDVVSWTAGTCLDTRADGPHEAGARVVHLVKQSEAHPENERVLDTAVWYPAAVGGTFDSLYRANRDAPVADDGPYPVLMFSHGSCGHERQSLFLMPYLATHGFIVVAPPHPGNTLFEFPNCGTPAAQAESFIERPVDILYARDQIIAAGRDPGSPFFGKIDESRIGMSGHSFGGLTTFLVTGMDPSFRVAVPMAPAAIGVDGTELTMPSMVMLGNIDSVVNNDQARALYAAASSPKRKVEILDAGHYAFSDGCFPGPDCDPPRTATQDEAHERVKRWILPFLKVYLEGDSSYRPLLETAPPQGTTLDKG